MAAGLGAISLLAVGCGGGGREQERATGPVAALYVVDHGGADPPDGALAPYEKAFGRVKAGCTITADALADRILHLADDATHGSGRDVSTLDALRAVARRVGTAPEDCTQVFLTAEAFLGGGATG
jgi:hypothetical protein